MGGPGSGGWGRYAVQTRVEDTLQLDIRHLCRKQLLRGASHTVFWRPRPGPIIPIQVRAHGSFVQLAYSANSAFAGRRRNVREYVGTTRTPCNFGGERIWWVCPRCESRVAILAFKAGLFGCRHCFKLIYACQRESSADRRLRAALKARARLGNELWLKPKGVHSTTYQKRFYSFLSAERRALDALRPRFIALSERLNL